MRTYAIEINCCHLIDTLLYILFNDVVRVLIIKFDFVRFLESSKIDVQKVIIKFNNIKMFRTRKQ
jgi:hypothetical protein